MKKTMIKNVAFATTTALTLTMALASCTNGEQDTMTDDTTDNTQVESGNDTSNDGEKEQVYYLNFKPEIAETYDAIAEAYEAETGVELKVVTAAAGTYESTLKSEIAKSNPPTLFQINGPRGYANWKNYTADLSNTEFYQHLTDKSLAVMDGDGVYGVPYVVEGYGIIYNDSIMDTYFASPSKTSSIMSMEEIDSFVDLKEVVEDMTAIKDELGIDGVFSSTSLLPGEDWRWQTHLANVPVYHEFVNKNVDLTSDETKTVEFMYSDEYKNIFDLYINNSVTAPAILGAKSVADSMAEFALGRSAMVQNGNWAWGQINGVDGNVVKEEDIKFLPIYTGIEGEENFGLNTGTENFFAINSQVSEEDQQLAADFVYWLFSSETGKNFVTNELGFIAPFDTFGEDEVPSDPLAKEIVRWMNSDKTSVPWNFTLFPNQTFKDSFGANLLAYSQGAITWDEVAEDFVADWEMESQN